MELKSILVGVIFIVVIPCITMFSICKWICWKYNAKKVLEMYKESSQELRKKDERLATLEYEYDALKDMYDAKLRQDYMPEIRNGSKQSRTPLQREQAHDSKSNRRPVSEGT